MNGKVDRCYRFVVVGFDKPVDPLSGLPAQGEGDPGKTGMPGGNDDPGKPGMPGGEGDFFGGTVVIQGGFSLGHMGAIEFPTFGAAQGWLASPIGQYFCKRFKDVSVIATFGCHPPA